MEANNFLCDILVSYPTDRFALKMVEKSYFVMGEKERMRDIVGRVMPLWTKDMRQYGYELHSLLLGETCKKRAKLKHSFFQLVSCLVLADS